MVGVFQKPGFLFGVWLVCLVSQIAAYYKISLPLWWVVISFFGVLVPVTKLIL